MATLTPFEQIDAGGVDSRSNPLNMPRNRALRCLNWVPKQAGFWELRYGYSTVSMSTVSASAISGLFPYRTWDGTKYVLFMQGTTLNLLNTGTGVVTTPTVRGAAVASSAKGSGYFMANRFHYGNGTDQKWFDGTTWRDSGLPVLTFLQINNILILEGVRELTAAQNSTITLVTAPGTGSISGPDLYTGHLVYVALFDTSTNELGPSTIAAANGTRVVFQNNDQLTVGNLPNLSSVNTNWIKLFAITLDGGQLAYFCTNGASPGVTSATRSGTTLTVHLETSFTFTPGVVVNLVIPNYAGVYVVATSSSTQFTVTLPFAAGPASVGGGSVTQLLTAANAATSIVIGAAGQGGLHLDQNYQVNQDRGLAASSVGGTQPGYQFYASIYNPNGGHVGNRISIGGRALQTAYRSNWHILGLPDLTGTDTEWCVLIGRTGDGAQVPYVAADNSINWLYAQPGQTSLVVSAPKTDGQHELPTRNGIIPSQCNMFCVAGDFAYAADPNSPYLRRSGDFSQSTERGNTFTGRPEQSWAPDDVDTFPTAEAMTGIFEVDQEVLCGTLHDTAISVNLAGIQQWVGPWNVGIAGKRAGTKCGAHGFFWLSGDKQLITLQQGAPVPVSEEYELAELAQIGDAFLSTVELVYYRNAALNKDELRIEGQKQDGTPYTVIHDFKLRDFNAPGSVYGQGYSSQFAGPLGTVFTSGQVRDSNGKLQVYAGSSTGQLYQLYSGADDVGNQYTADTILLLNGGPNRPSVPFFDFYGDQNIQITLGRNLQTSLAVGAQWGFTPPGQDADQPQAVPGATEDFLYRVFLDPQEVQRLYVRFQLTSHSADGNLNLNSPPHLPLENYGRLYEFIPSVGDERER